jgi:hypothetical protein
MAGEEGTEKRPARGRYLAEYVRVIRTTPRSSRIKSSTPKRARSGTSSASPVG